LPWIIIALLIERAEREEQRKVKERKVKEGKDKGFNTKIQRHEGKKRRPADERERRN
jgi:hypothetical protein